MFGLDEVKVAALVEYRVGINVFLFYTLHATHTIIQKNYTGLSGISAPPTCQKQKKEWGLAVGSPK